MKNIIVYIIAAAGVLAVLAAYCCELVLQGVKLKYAVIFIFVAAAVFLIGFFAAKIFAKKFYNKK